MLESTNKQDTYKTPSINNVNHRLDLDLFSEECRGIVKEYICHICKGVLNYPLWNEACQHVFCKECLISNNMITCPQCLEEGIISKFDAISQTKPVYVLISLLEKQIILCKNLCGWKSQVKELKSHYALCPKLKVKCFLDGCNMEICQDEKMTHELTCEYRIVECEKCNEKIIKKNENFHTNQCLYEVISCANNCGQEILRKDMESHIKSTCRNIPMSCELEIVGCKEKFLRKNLNDHVSNFFDYHSELFLKFLSNTKKSIDNKMNSYDSVLNEIKEKLSFFQQQNKILDEVEEKRKEEEGITKFLNRKQKRGKRNLNLNEIIVTEDKNLSSEIEIKDKQSDASTSLFELVSKENFLITNGITIKKENEFYKFDINSIISTKHSHEFLLVDHKLNSKDEDSLFKFRIEINKENFISKNWFAIGICVKEILIKNDLMIKNNFLEADHGIFGISSDGVLFHNNSSYKNNSKIQNFPNFQIIDSKLTNYSKFKFEYEYDKKILKITIDDEFTIKIDMVFPIQPNMTLLPCLIFETKFDESKIYFE